MKKYQLVLNSDNGKAVMQVSANDIQQALDKGLNYANAPVRAIISITEVEDD